VEPDEQSDREPDQQPDGHMTSARAVSARQAPTLRPPRHLVSKRAIGYWTVRATPIWLIITAIQVIWWLNDSKHYRAHLIGIIVTALLAGIHLLVMPQWRFRVHRWETTPQAVYTQAGWFNQERRIAPISRIQTVDSHRGPFEQIFGLANVTVTTASAAGPLRIHGLDRAVAQQLVDELTTITQRTPGDAT
jgi:membrane protein YdbS with pleckstrin-like domain